MQATDTRTAIVEAAARLYADLGYSAVSMRDVASEVGVTPANLYHHFKGKGELIQEALAHVFTHKAASLEALLDTSRDADKRLETFVRWFAHLLVDDRIFFRLLIRELTDGDAGRLEYLSKTVLERPFALVRSLARARIRDGDDDFLAAVSIIGVVLGHVQLGAIVRHLPGGRSDHLDPDVIIRHVLAALRESFKTPPAKDA
ncbi:TetR/AcrR family transcriptional regulator [Allorhizobium sp. NPDC080224]|uniref:TetR family transcriptional regulator n=2 Tax=Alphaproteobacteria TaxID=28211 RepID=A0A512HKP1_9HYPH|nr:MULTISPECIES: TetR/AcrR family transcriptional regulator [Alphaproteobacteria]NTE55340.1 TetR/AcrR family transcriptional regulator [Agrobacterium tumefaciens]NTE72756.1 TetR/AcrR family transcriptional regulator [Agrobacterium tumefaciens]GEO86016.1 TetR family transcriptional regulator [Ciceribacter naphthalenivorans]GLR23523.1 TetR family transcriptional regulator [Ciceribacter naphthalenivorans]GLT06379.1 TetR family transcriptional regulator [Sphingomonas psychrolutea]